LAPSPSNVPFRFPVLTLPISRFSQPSYGFSFVRSFWFVGLFHPTGTCRIHKLQSFTCLSSRFAISGGLLLLRGCFSPMVFFSGLMRFPASDRRAYARSDLVLPEPLTGCPVGFHFGIQSALELCSRHQACLSTLGFTPLPPQ
jgi:hypothetical protein